MKNPRVIAGVTVLVLIVGVVVALFLDRGAAAEERPAPAATQATTPAGPSSSAPVQQPEQTPTPEATATPSPEPVVEEDHGDDLAIGGLDATLTPDERAAAWDAAVTVATALTTQGPEEADRAARLAPLFAPGSPAVGLEGPAPFDAVVQPQTLGWVKPFAVEDDRSLGVLVNIHYEVVRQGADGYGEFGEGDAEWLIHMVRDGAGAWVASDAELSAATDL